jgi:hypothetical protein
MRPGALEAIHRRLTGLLWWLRWEDTDYSCACGYGQLRRAMVLSGELDIYICDECELTWMSRIFTDETSTELSAVIKAYGIEDDDFAVLR